MRRFVKFVACQTQRVTVDKDNPNNNFRLIFVIAGFLLLCVGLSSAFGCLLPENQAYNPEIRVDSCHIVVSQKNTPPCCQSESCHQTTSRERDLGRPEYQIQHKDSHALVLETHSLTPKLKVGEPLSIRHIIRPQVLFSTAVPQIPLQSLNSLRTVVLLN